MKIFCVSYPAPSTKASVGLFTRRSPARLIIWRAVGIDPAQRRVDNH
jgi:hypothetical protein